MKRLHRKKLPIKKNERERIKSIEENLKKSEELRGKDRPE